MLCTPNNVHHYFFAQVCQGIRCALVGGIIVPSMVRPAKPCSTQTRPAQNHFLLGHAHSAQPPPKPCPNLPPLKAIPCSTTPITCSNHALPKPCPKPALLKQALLEPRPAQTTTCSTCPAQPSLPHAHILLKPHPTQALPKRRPRSKPYLAQPRPSPALSNKPPLCQILP